MGSVTCSGWLRAILAGQVCYKAVMAFVCKSCLPPSPLQFFSSKCSSVGKCKQKNPLVLFFPILPLSEERLQGTLLQSCLPFTCLWQKPSIPSVGRASACGKPLQKMCCIIIVHHYFELFFLPGNYTLVSKSSVLAGGRLQYHISGQ